MKGVIIHVLRLPPKERCKLIEDLWIGRVAYPSPGMPLEIERGGVTESRLCGTQPVRAGAGTQITLVSRTNGRLGAGFETRP